MSAAETEPLDVATADGEVLLSGAGGTALSLTPEAAAATGRALLNNAAEAGACSEVFELRLRKNLIEPQR